MYGKEAPTIASFLYQITAALTAGAVFLAMISIVYMSWKNGISPMPASVPVRHAVAAEVNRLAGCSVVVEAGSGWGTLGLHVVRHCPDKQVIGIENSPLPLWTARFAARLVVRFLPKAYAAPLANIKFIHADIYTYSYANAETVVCYLYPGAMKRLSTILEKRLPPGAKIISVCFAIPGWQPERVVTCGDMYRTKVYVYSV